MSWKVILSVSCAAIIFADAESGDLIHFVPLSENGSESAHISNLTGITRSFEYYEAQSKPSEFPSEIFSDEALRHGAILLHFFGAIYSFASIAIICGDYFLPSVDCICSELNLSQDVGAATFMSFATTAPELFVILIATFLTKSDIGLGAVVGSGMFNILGVATVGGLAASTPIKLDWWPLFRDSFVYMISVIILIIDLSDGKISFIESVILIIYYFVYFSVMFFNRRMRKRAKSCLKFIQNKLKSKKVAPVEKPPPIPTINLTVENDSLQKRNSFNISKATSNDENEDDDTDDNAYKAYFMNYDDSISLRRISACSRISNFSDRRKSVKSLAERRPSGYYLQTNPNQLQVDAPDKFVPKITEKSDEKYVIEEEFNEEAQEQNFSTIFLTFPEGSLWTKFTWLCLWPISFIFFWTIPDCRSEKWKKYYPLTFFMCILSIGVCSYFGTWMITRMGETIGISDSIMGLTFLALGGSMPEAISTYIMARQGEGGLGFSNSLGGNTMDICLCLGLPWLIQTFIYGPVVIHSGGIQYNAIALLVGIVILILVGISTKFHMNRRMGLICCTFYMLFIVISVLIELQVIALDIQS